MAQRHGGHADGQERKLGPAASWGNPGEAVGQAGQRFGVEGPDGNLSASTGIRRDLSVVADVLHQSGHRIRQGLTQVDVVVLVKLVPVTWTGVSSPARPTAGVIN